MPLEVCTSCAFLLLFLRTSTTTDHDIIVNSTITLLNHIISSLERTDIATTFYVHKFGPVAGVMKFSCLCSC
jgi:hypothetical protein